MDMGLFRGVVTLVLLVLFIGLCAWSFSKRRRAEYEAAAQLPLREDDRPVSRDQQESPK